MDKGCAAQFTKREITMREVTENFICTYKLTEEVANANRVEYDDLEFNEWPRELHWTFSYGGKIVSPLPGMYQRPTSHAD